MDDPEAVRRMLSPAKLPSLKDVIPFEVDVPNVPEVIQSLYGMRDELRLWDISAIDYYRELSVSEVLLSPSVAPRAHIDGGAMASTTNRLDYMWCYREATPQERRSLPRLRVADDTVHSPVGTGYIKVPCKDSPGYSFVPTFYTPQLPATIVSPDCLGKSLGCQGYHTFSDFVHDEAILQLTDCAKCKRDVHFDLRRIRGLLYSSPLIPATEQEHKASTLPEVAPTDNCQHPTSPFPYANSDIPIQVLNKDQQRALWHMRLGHLNERDVTDLHNHVSGIPKLPRSDALHKCPICAQAKLHKAARIPKEEERETCECFQHVQVDFGFFVVQSSGRKTPKKKSKPTTTTKTAGSRRTKAIRSLSVRPLRRSARLRSRAQSIPEESTTEAPQPTSPRARPIVETVPEDSDAESVEASTRASPIVETIPEDSDDESLGPPPLYEDDDSSDDGSSVSSGSLPDISTPDVSNPPLDLPEDPLDSERYTFKRIVTHEGPLQRSHKRYKGTPFNLKIEWSTNTTTWEPYDRVFEDDPHSVISYARKRNLLNNPHWSFVRDAAISSIPEGQHDVDFDDVTELPDRDYREPPNIPPLTDDERAEKAANANKRFERLVGLNGETCYCMITCRKSGTCRISIRKDKVAPIDFFKEFLSRYGSANGYRSVRFDQGGELGKNKKVTELWEAAGYEVETTAPDSSNEIGMVERPHRTIADAIRSMLFAAGLELKFWPYALRYWLIINDIVPHGQREHSPHFICTGKVADVSLLRVFGCRVYVQPTGKRDGKATVNARTGIFLGYKRSMRHAYYYDIQSKKVLTARNLVFDEGMNDSTDPPPYVRFLRGELPKEEIDLQNATPEMQIHLTPFVNVEEVECDFHARASQPLGFQLGRCPRFSRAYANSFNRRFGTYSKDVANRRFLGGYILKVGEIFTFSPEDVAAAVDHYKSLDDPPAKLSIRIARDQRVQLHDSRPPALSLRPVDLRRIAAMPLVAGEGDSVQQRRRLRELASTPIPSSTPPDPDDIEPLSWDELLDVRKMVNEHMTEEERQLPSFSRKNLMTLPNWEEWRKADHKQLDSHFESGTIGKAVPRPAKDPDHPSQVFRIVWARLVKATGVRKSRACLDGSKRAAPWLRQMVQTYSSCIEHPCLRLFIAECVNRGYYICFGDVDNAFQQAPPPTHQCYLEVDDTVWDWYFTKFGVKLDRMKDVIPLWRALQGHPEASVLWQRMIEDILINKMGFRHTTHEHNLYIGAIDGEEVLVCRQVDDFASGAAKLETSKKFIECIREYVSAEYTAMGMETSQGVTQLYNGIDVIQTRDYVKIGCESYIDRMLQTHGWDTPPHKDSPNIVPLAPTVVEKLQKLEGPPEKSPEARAIERSYGFSYRNLLGELMYAYVIVRLDIGYSVCMLARYSGAPHEQHFKALRGVCKYLRANKSWGLIYHRPRPLPGLPVGDFVFVEEDPDLPMFPSFGRNEIVALLDAAHATDPRTRRSVTGLIVFFCNAAIAWKSRLQSLVATSSTEAEFYAAVMCAKIVKYLRYVARDLAALAPGPSPMYIDNLAALFMINERRPTPRARHIETQHFAIQEWRRDGDIIMRHLTGILNSSDGLTKAVGTTLHYRHARRGMGHYRLVSPNDSEDSPLVPDARVEIVEAGEGVGAQSGSLAGHGRG